MHVKKTVLLLFLLIHFSMIDAQEKKQPGGKKSDQPEIFKTDIPDHPFNIIIGRPTNTSITVSILAFDSLQGFIKYGTKKELLNNSTSKFSVSKGKTAFIDLTKLEADKRYYYQFVGNSETQKSKVVSDIYFFQTQRAANSEFVFTIQADSHLDNNSDTGMYQRTLQNMAADAPDFLMDLGDTWMTDKYRTDFKESSKQYIAQRYFMSSLCRSSSLFLTLGNHDGESGQQLNKRNSENMTQWSTAMRNNFYPNPFPNGFYTGNTDKENGNDFIKNYYAWEWGNALFVVLDPFRYTNNNRFPWMRTLGQQQYNWLKNTLEKSKAKFKFVFIHNLVGGVDNDGIARGGIEAAPFYEWGGLDANGTNTFSTNRRGWDNPLHDLFKQTKVTVVFHGHDHFFAKQDLDGIVYQLIPQPGSIKYDNRNGNAQYGYQQGTIFNAPGYMRVTMKEQKALFEFVQTSNDNKHLNGKILYSYTLN